MHVHVPAAMRTLTAAHRSADDVCPRLSSCQARYCAARRMQAARGLGEQHGLHTSSIVSGVLRAPAVLDANVQCSKYQHSVGGAELRR